MITFLQYGHLCNQTTAPRKSQTDPAPGVGPTSVLQDFLTLKLDASNLTTIWAECSRIAKMISHDYSQRYYYYYGPLSIWRDGRAMGCRELIT
jgi:hypothetical protein